LKPDSLAQTYRNTRRVSGGDWVVFSLNSPSQ
jgi:hypothetical protein